MKADDMNIANMYLDGELDQEDRDDFDGRLLSEAHLRTYVNEMKALDASAAGLEVFRAPEVSFSRGTRPWLGSMERQIRPFLAGVAVAAACILIGIGMGSRLFKSPAAAVRTEAFRMVYYAPGADSVSVLGDFNGWSDEIPLKSKGEGGYWLAEIQVKPGEYRYILIVDGIERPGDPLADYVIDDDFGSKNSVVRIGL